MILVRNFILINNRVKTWLEKWEVVCTQYSSIDILQGYHASKNALKFAFVSFCVQSKVFLKIPKSPNFLKFSIKVGLSHSKNFSYLLHWKTLKMMKNVLYFILKAFFILKIYKFLSWFFAHAGKKAWLEHSHWLSLER